MKKVGTEAGTQMQIHVEKEFINKKELKFTQQTRQSMAWHEIRNKKKQTTKKQTHEQTQSKK